MEEQKTLSQTIRELPQSKGLTSAQLPNIDLYIDQIITLMGAERTPKKQGDKNKVFTRAMVNNYTKEGLLKQIKGKKYSKAHVLIMELIRTLKQSLSINDINTLLEAANERISQDRYTYLPGVVEELYDSCLQIRCWERERFLGLLEEFEREFSIHQECREDLLFSVFFLSSLANMASEGAQKLLESYRQSSSPMGQ